MPRSKLLVPGDSSVLRPRLDRAPTPVCMYCAAPPPGSGSAKYATVCAAKQVPSEGAQVLLLSRGLDVVPVPRMPEGFKIARSPAESRFKFESWLACTVTHSPVS